MIAAHERKIEAFIHLHFCQQLDEKRRRDRAQETMTDHQGEERGFSQCQASLHGSNLSFGGDVDG